MSKYDLLSQDELEERFLPPHPDTSPSLDRRKSQISRISPLLCLITSTILFLSSLALFIYSYRTLTNADSQCYSKWNTPSPLQEAINPPITTRVDGRFWKEDSYKGPPSPERDTAWEELTDGPDGGVTTISREQLVAMNASEHSIELPNGRYPASFEVVHLMHCLNFLRQATYEEYYKDKALPWHDSLGTVRVHMDHCIDILRQKVRKEKKHWWSASR